MAREGQQKALNILFLILVDMSQAQALNLANHRSYNEDIYINS